MHSVHLFGHVLCTSPLHPMHWCTLCTRSTSQPVIGDLRIPRPRDPRKILLERAIFSCASFGIDRELPAGVLLHRRFIDPIDSWLTPGRISRRELGKNSTLTQGAKDVLHFALAEFAIGRVSRDGGSTRRAVTAVPAHRHQDKQLQRFECVPPEVCAKRRGFWR